MSLDKYAQKRDFSRTPEPAGELHQATGTREFVIQKHHASRLHYDFRLELDGVLISWAVPKGPSLQPDDKRLAMKVEDHPFDYRTFEGTIPAGEYGAGQVIVWDHGTYGCVHPTGDLQADDDHLRAGLAKGHLAFMLYGTKLSGEWVLQRLKDGQDNAWILFKAHDSFASNVDVTTLDRSSRSNRTLDDIAANKEHAPTDLLTAAPMASFPKDSQPMLASVAEAAFDSDDWLFEIKWDGYRAIASWSEGAANLTSRRGVSFNSKYPKLIEELTQLPAGDAILDGEIVVLDEAGVSRFSDLADYNASSGQLCYYVFDLLYLNGHDTTKLPLETRKQLLADWLPKLASVRYSDHVIGRGKDFYDLAANKGLEGVMAKLRSSRYLPGRRSQSWRKIKTHAQQEAVIGGFTSPRGGRTGLGALVLGVTAEDGTLTYIGHTGTGFTDRQLRHLSTKLAALRTDASPFSTTFKVNAPVTWVEPRLVCEVSFREWTSDGHLRQPVFLGLREDKIAPEVHREPTTPEPKAPVEAVKDPIVTNPDKIYWPDTGYTKGDLISYYASMSEFIIPYLADRPQSLHRFPSGINGSHFYHKNLDDAPSWLRTETIHSDSEDKDLHYAVADDVKALKYLINLGCIELHPWNSKVQSLDRPDWCVIDLDPEAVAFDEVVRTALVVRDVLHSAGITSYPKTSGATGIHIYIPMAARYSYEQVKNFAHVIAALVHARLPKTTSLERSPAKRQARVYLDYLQNRRGQTLAAPYCVRPRPGMPVSTPLEWSEVIPSLRPESFTVLSTPDRVRDKGDLWRPVIGPGIDMMAALSKLQ